MTALGALLGAAFGAGLVVAVSSAPPLRRVRLEQRLAPYVRDVSLAAAPPRRAALAPLLDEAAGRLDRWLGGTASLRAGLARAGRDITPRQFRAEQVAVGAAAFLAATALAALALLRGRGSVAGAAVFCLGCGVLGALGRDRWLAVEISRREAAMLAALPDVAELLALAVTAGEGPRAALERVARHAPGALGAELDRVVGEARAGRPLVEALDELAARTGVLPLARFIDGLVVAIERGTPLGDVLRAQAGDVRDAGRRALLESAGRREIAMLVPVVFLVLPVTVVFALFPGFYGLRLLAP